ncbi:MAG: tripartite tricarboxylate transporter substrate binding protein, partial [Burkholderiales bacterium]
MRKVPVAAALLALATLAGAQDYPNKPLRFVVPYAPGGASDVTARLLGQKLTEAWGQAVAVDNRPGANGIVALEFVAKSPADGYTILMANLGPNAINPAVYSKLPYDPVKDFSPVTLTTLVPNILVVNPYLPAKTLKEVFALARAKPDQLSYGTGGYGSSNHLSMELMKSMTGIHITHVPYKGDVPAMTDAIAGQIAMSVPTVVAATPYLKSGKLRAIAVTSKSRVRSLPDVPTVAEAAVPGFESVSWGGVMAPGGTPVALVNKLNAELVRILKLPDMQERLQALGAEVVGSSPAEFAAYLSA